MCSASDHDPFQLSDEDAANAWLNTQAGVILGQIERSLRLASPAVRRGIDGILRDANLRTIWGKPIDHTHAWVVLKRVSRLQWMTERYPDKYSPANS